MLEYDGMGNIGGKDRHMAPECRHCFGRIGSSSLSVKFSLPTGVLDCLHLYGQSKLSRKLKIVVPFNGATGMTRYLG